MDTQQREVIAMSLSGCLVLRCKNFAIPTYFHLSESIIAPIYSSEHKSLTAANSGEATNTSANKTLSQQQVNNKCLEQLISRDTQESGTLLM
jgi:hypothetical protein